MLRFALGVSAAAAVLLLAASAGASAPPPGPLPPGPSSTISTTKGQLVAVALPHVPGKSWRLARGVNPAVLLERSERDVYRDVVIVFKAVGRGTATLRYALTIGETRHVYQSRTVVVHVR